MRNAVRCAGSAMLVGLLAWRLDWRQLGEAFAGLDLRLWVLAVLTYVGAQLVSSLRWQLLARPLGFAEPWRRFVALYFVGMFFNLVLPTSVGGDVVRAWYLGGRPGRRGQAFLTVLAERGCGVVVLLVLACALAPFVPVKLPAWMVGLLGALGAGLVAGLAALPFLARQPLLTRKLLPLVEVVRTYAGRPALLGTAALLSLIVQLGSVGQAWLVSVALGLEVPFAYLAIVVPLVTLLTLVPLSVNGVGLREVGLVVLLAPAGVTAAQAVTLSILQFAVCVTASLAGGAFLGDMAMTSLSVVIPIKDEKDNLRPLHDRLRHALDPLVGAPGSAGLSDYEIVLVDDGSSDGSLDVLRELARKDRRVKVVALRRNYGQTPALRAGIDWSTGDVVVTMDGDLQNDPADVPLLLEKLAEGYDAVFGLRKKRQDRLFVRKLPSLAGNWLIRKVTGVTVKDMGCTLRALRRELAEALPLYGELHRFVPVLAKMHGARFVQVEVSHHPRLAGQTKYTLSRTVRVLLDLITVTFLHRYLTRPMHALGVPGLACMALGFLALLATLWMKYVSSNRVFMTGNPLLHLSVMLEMMGVQFISMGLLGEVLARTYFESQGKSAYAVRTTLNLEAEERRAA